MCVYGKVALVVTILCAQPGIAKPLVEAFDRITINWGTLKVRFFGESFEKEKAFSESEKAALLEGIQDFRNNMGQNESWFRRVAPTTADAGPNDAISQFIKGVYSVHSEYFKDGSVKVHLENSISKLLPGLTRSFQPLEVSAPQVEAPASGIVIKLDRAISPSLFYKLTNEKGEVLFDTNTQIIDAGFAKHLTGHWFQRPTTDEVLSIAGSKAETFLATLKNDQEFVIAAADTERLQAAFEALSNGRIIIALP